MSKQISPMNKFLKSALNLSPLLVGISIGLCFECVLVSQSAWGQIRPDNTLGSEASRVVPDLGASVDSIQGGATRGQLLFHSFSDLNVEAGSSVFFANPLGISDIFSRVTGDSVSNIDGVLGVDGPANLYLLNPNGIFFGPDAELDLKGSFFAGTGDHILFSNDLDFSATAPQSVPLVNFSVPLGVQYGRSPGEISITTSLLTRPEGTTSAFVGGAINIDSATISTPASSLEIGTVANSIVKIDTDNILNLEFEEAMLAGDIRILNSTLFTGVTGNGDGGNLTVTSESAVIQNSRLNTSVIDGAAGDLMLEIQDSLFITDNSVLTSELFGDGTGGQLSINAGSANISNTRIDTSVIDGDSGVVYIEIGENLSIMDSLIRTTLFGDGTGGNIFILTGGDMFSGNTRFLAETRRSSLGDSGDISIVAGGSLDFLGTGLLTRTGNNSTSTENSSIGNGGDISIVANSANFQESELNTLANEGNSGNLSLEIAEDLSVSNQSNLTSNINSGNGGGINISARNIFLSNTILDSIIFDQGRAGDISLIAQNSISLNNTTLNSSVDIGDNAIGGNIILNSQDILAEQSQLITRLSGSGAAGNIAINTTDLSRFANTNFFTNTINEAIGDGGDITITANSVDFLQGQLISGLSGTGDAGSIAIETAGQGRFLDAGFFTDTINESIGNGGDITITANSVDFQQSQLLARLSGTGDAGNISIETDGQSYFINTNFFTDTINEAVGDGGDITITANSVDFQQSSLTANLSGTGDAGNISIETDGQSRFLNTNFFTSTDDDALGNGGNIEITGQELLFLESNLLTRTGNNSSGNGGDISIVANSANFQESELNTLANEGNSGNLSLEIAGDLSVSNQSNLTSNINSGNGGGINISAINIFLSDSILDSIIFEQGRAGDISLIAQNSISLSNTTLNSGVDTGDNAIGGNIILNSQDILAEQSQLITRLSGSGAAGNITINTTGPSRFLNTNLFTDTINDAVGDGGDIQLTVQELLFEGSSDGTQGFQSNSSGRGNAGNIQIIAEGAVTLNKLGSGSVAFFSTVEENGEGRSGDIEIIADSLSFETAALINGIRSGSGDIGDIILDIENLTFLSGGGIFNNLDSTGNGGTIKIETGDLVLENGAQLFTTTVGQGPAGNVFIDADNSVRISGIGEQEVRPSSIFSSSDAGATGRAGNIVINVPFILLEDSGVINGRTETAERGGNITLNTDRLALINGGQLVTSTSGTGEAGDIQVNATNSVTLSAFNENFDDFLNNPARQRTDVDRQRADVEGPASGFYAVGAEGIGGSVTVNTDELYVQRQANISVSTEGLGEAGRIEITANTVQLEDQASLTAETVLASGGDIVLQIADTLELDTGSEISASTGEGIGGAISIDGAELVELKDGSNITVEARLGGGVAGDLTIAADTIRLSDSSLTAITQGDNEQGANISIKDTGILLLRNGSQITAQALNTANGGNIGIESGIILGPPNENNDIIANAATGDGGSINLRGDRVFGFTTATNSTTTQLRNNTTNDISASSQFGQSGEIVLENLGLDPSQGLFEIPIIAAPSNVQNDCLAIGQSGTSNFIITGQRDRPTAPTAPLGENELSVDLGPEVITQSIQNASTSSPANLTSSANRDAEAQSWVRDENGKFFFVSQSFEETSAQRRHSCSSITTNS